MIMTGKKLTEKGMKYGGTYFRVIYDSDGTIVESFPTLTEQSSTISGEIELQKKNTMNSYKKAIMSPDFFYNDVI